MPFADLLPSLGGLRPIRDTLIPVPESELATLERTLGASLPDSYRAFLETYGACSFRELVELDPRVPLPASCSRSGRGFLDRFYGATAHAPHDLIATLERYRTRMPEGFLPIGGDGGGNQLAMVIVGDDRGAIHHWDHHREWDEEDYVEDGLPVPADLKWQNLTLVAEGFEELFTRLSIHRGE